MAAAKGPQIETTPTEPPGGRPLVVRRSHVSAGGIIRVSEALRAELDLPANSLVEVTFGKRSVAVRLFADEQVPTGEIVLRPQEMQRLGVTEGAQVLLRTYQPALAAMRQSFRGVGSRIEHRVRRLRPRKSTRS